LEYLSTLYLPGAVATWCALLFAVTCLYGYALVLQGDATAVPFARRSYRLFALSVVLVAVVLGVLLVRRDFRIEYVYQYSGLDLPVHYQFAAFWAGQKGSFLIWLFWGAVLGLPLIKASGRREAPVMAVYTLTLIGLLFILVRENPFVMLTEAPVDGKGLNPLLQDDWMVIHPPIMFVGYSLTAMPFAFAVAALWRKDYDGWARRAFPWALAGFLVLGCAILMGGYWAYKTLGWGGYWGWDPVENASLIPWILGVALIHGLHMERAKGRYRKANLLLACLGYLAVLYGTFLTRSGVLADFSVHSFVDLGISGWLVGLMAVFFLLSMGLLAWRWRSIPTVKNEDPLTNAEGETVLSRGTVMVLATIVLLLAAAVVTFGTSAPLVTRWFMDNPAQVGPEWYNRVNFPLALLVTVLLSFVPASTWRGVSFPKAVRKMAVGAGVAVGIAVLAAVLGVRDVFHLLFVFLAGLALVTNLQKTFARAQVGGLKAAGGYLSHVGVGIILLGFLSSSAYDQSAKVTLLQGQPTEVDGMTLTFTRFIPRRGHEKEAMEVEVVRENGERYWSYPRLFVNDRTRQVMAHPHVRTTPFQDLYISPIDYDPGAPAGAPTSFELAKGQGEVLENGTEVRFVGFDMNVRGDAMAAMASGRPVTIGAVLEIGGEETPEPVSMTATYTFATSTQGADVEAPPVQLPNGGWLRVGGINATSGAVRLDVVGIGDDTGPTAPKLSVDVTRKPLIQLVWFGLYVILAGGGLAAWQRWREVRVWEKVGEQQTEP
jgi:cytochrome c-type biogenesis protein CcmF